MDIRNIREMRFGHETFRSYHAGMIEKLTVANRQLALWAATVDARYPEHEQALHQVAGWGEIARNLYETIETLTGVARISQTPIETLIDDLSDKIETLSDNIETATASIDETATTVRELSETVYDAMSDLERYGKAWDGISVPQGPTGPAN